MEIIQENAQEIVAGTDLIEKPIRYKTLYYGLKLNHARNVAVVHPLMYTLRRVIYALTIVLIATLPLIGVWIMLASTLIMLAYALLESQWKAGIINHQHVFNEIITYFVCLYLLLFTNLVSAETRVYLGYLLLGFFLCFIVYNTIIMLLCLCHAIKLLLRRCVTKSRREKLKSEAAFVLSKIKRALDSIMDRGRENADELDDDEKGWFVPDELDTIWDPVIKTNE